MFIRQTSCITYQTPYFSIMIFCPPYPWSATLRIIKVFSPWFEDKPLSLGSKNYFGYNLVHTPLLSTESESESSLVSLRRSMSCCCCWSSNFRSCCCFLMRRSLFIWCSWISNSVNFSCSSWSLSSSIRRCWCPSTTWFSCCVGASLANDTIPVFSACVHKSRQPQRHTSTLLKTLSLTLHEKSPRFPTKRKDHFCKRIKSKSQRMALGSP